MSEVSLDEIDEAILYYLQDEGRRTVTDIADAIDVSDNTVRNRIQAMEDADVITGYQAVVDYDRAGVPHHYVFVCTARVSHRDRLAAQAQDLQGVVEVTTLMTGTQNILVVAARRDKDGITELACAIDELGLTIEHEELIRSRTTRPYDGFRPPEYRGKKQS